MKYAALILSIIFLQACDHPLEIVGEGDITEVTGSDRGCTLEQYQADEKTCRKNTVIGAYDVSYYPVAHDGWEFAYWEGYCQANSPQPYCNITVGADVVKKNWFKTVPALRAVFTDTGPWFRDIDGDGFGDEFDEGFYGVQPDPSYVKDFSDCNDDAATVYPEATELVDLLDNNCNGVIDENTKYVFVSESYDGNLGGLSGADALCQAEADNAFTPLPGQYFAYLSTKTVDARDRNTYVDEENYQWRQVDGLLLANCWSCFYDDGALNHGARLHLDENGTSSSIPGELRDLAWTGTQNGGTKRAGFSSACDAWTVNSIETAGVGNYSVESHHGDWQESGYGYGCAADLRLYCIQR